MKFLLNIGNTHSDIRAGDCHGDVVEDFASRTHAEVRCTTCHIFFRETQDAGRILRDADPRFCLLCHRAADFSMNST